MHEHDGLAAIEFRSIMGTQPRQQRYARRTDSGALDLMALVLIEAEAREQPLTAAARRAARRRQWNSKSATCRKLIGAWLQDERIR